MPWCPDCRYEYRDHVAVCPDCGATLVAELPSDEPISGELELRELPPLPGRPYAEMLTEALTGAGIHGILLDKGALAAYRVQGTQMGNVVVQVAAAQYARAMDIYDTLFPDVDA